MGTVAYMSPEQVRAEEVDARTDLFAFGAVLYEMATGELAFSGSSSGVIFEAILNRNPPEPSTLNPKLPAKLEEVISKSLDKDRELRYQTAAELRGDLKRIKRGLESSRAHISAASVSASSGQIPAAAPVIAEKNCSAISGVLYAVARDCRGRVAHRSSGWSASIQTPRAGNIAAYISSAGVSPRNRALSAIYS